MSKDRDRLEKVIAVALNPGAYEEEAITALRKARELPAAALGAALKGRSAFVATFQIAVNVTVVLPSTNAVMAVETSE